MKDNYPFSTSEGTAIPLDILKPSGLLIGSVALAATSFDLSAHEVATFAATEDCVVRFGAAIPDPLTSGAVISDMLLVPKGTIVVSSIRDPAIYVRTLSAATGTIYVQCIERWAGIALDRQYSKKF